MNTIRAWLVWLWSLLRSVIRRRPQAEKEATRVKETFEHRQVRFRFNGRFDPTVHKALPELQRRAAQALFQQLELEWVPGEYWQCLEEHPDPTEAFSMFCDKYGLDLSRIRRRNRDELARLLQCVGIMVEIGMLPQGNRPAIRQRLATQDYADAEELLDRARTTLAVIEEIERMSGAIVFPGFVGFVGAVQAYRGNLFGLTLDEARNAQQTLEEFKRFQQDFDHLIASLDSLLGWLITNWPENEWGEANTALRNGFVVEKERLERELKSSTDADIAALLQDLSVVLTDLRGFLPEVAKQSGAAWEAPDDAGSAERESKTQWALKELGLTELELPDATTLKAAYRKLAMRYHPDRNPGDKTAEAKFKDVNEANDFIERLIGA